MTTPVSWQMPPDQLGRALINLVLGHEGGYVNHPSDRGGPTIWGVTEATARRAGYKGDMRLMSRNQAIDIYIWFFRRNRFDRIAAAGMPRLAYAMLDFGVNSGNGRPAEALQRALNALNLHGTRWRDLVVDGAIGPATIAALTASAKAFPNGEAQRLLNFTVNSLRVAFVINLAERTPSQEAFMLGWLRRYLQVAEYSGYDG